MPCCTLTAPSGTASRTGSRPRPRRRTPARLESRPRRRARVAVAGQRAGCAATARSAGRAPRPPRRSAPTEKRVARSASRTPAPRRVPRRRARRAPRRRSATRSAGRARREKEDAPSRRRRERERTSTRTRLLGCWGRGVARRRRRIAVLLRTVDRGAALAAIKAPSAARRRLRFVVAAVRWMSSRPARVVAGRRVERGGAGSREVRCHVAASTCYIAQRLRVGNAGACARSSHAQLAGTRQPNMLRPGYRLVPTRNRSLLVPLNSDEWRLFFYGFPLNSRGVRAARRSDFRLDREQGDSLSSLSRFHGLRPRVTKFRLLFLLDCILVDAAFDRPDLAVRLGAATAVLLAHRWANAVPRR